MVSITSPFTLLAKAVRAFFKSDVRLRRGERGLEVVLDEAPPEPKKGKGRSSKPNLQQIKEQRELQDIRASLAVVLDELPGNRTTLRHLAFLEHALAKKGLRAVNKVPYDVLKRALEQFEGLVVNWSDEGLATLRSKMAVALIEREPEATQSRAVAEPISEMLEEAPLVHPEPLEGEDAEAAQAALMAAYGAVDMQPLELALADGEPAVELHGELSSPSGKALAKAVRRGTNDVLPAALSFRETQT
jgi:hypothetical protein